MKRPRITRERSGHKTSLIAHVLGQRPLTKNFPENGLHWTVRYCTLDDTVPLLHGDEEALLERAMKLGRPLAEREAKAMLLARRLVAATA